MRQILPKRQHTVLEAPYAVVAAPLLQPHYLIGLWSFRTLDDIEFDRVAFLKTFVSFKLDGTVMDKDIRAIFSS